MTIGLLLTQLPGLLASIGSGSRLDNADSPDSAQAGAPAPLPYAAPPPAKKTPSAHTSVFGPLPTDLSDPSDTHIIAGRKAYTSGDYEKAHAAYSKRIQLKSRDVLARRLRIETSQKLLSKNKKKFNPSQATDAEKKSFQDKQQQLQRCILADSAMVMAIETPHAKKKLKAMTAQLKKAHDLPTPQKKQIIKAIEGMAQEYLLLGSVPYSNGQDAAFVRKQLSDLASDCFTVLRDFCTADSDTKIQARGKLYDGYKSLAEGKVKDAVTQFKKIQQTAFNTFNVSTHEELAKYIEDIKKDIRAAEANGKPKEAQELRNLIPVGAIEASTIVNRIETKRLMQINLHALDAWKSYIEEGSAVEANETNGWIGQGIQFIQLVGQDLGISKGTIQDNQAKYWNREKRLVGTIQKMLVRGDCTTIQAALQKIQSNGPAEFKPRATQLLREQHQNTVPGVRPDAGYALPHLISYTSTLTPTPAMAQKLVEDTIRFDTQHMAVKTPAHIFSLVAATTQDTDSKKLARQRFDLLQKEKGVGDVIGSIIASESGPMLAFDILTFRAAGKVGLKATARAGTVLGKAGIKGRRGVVLSRAAGISAESAAFWGIGAAREGALHNTSQVYTAEHLAKNFGADLIMMTFLKGVVPGLNQLSYRGVRVLGMTTRGGLELTRAGKILAWASGHTAGVGGMFAAGQTSDYLGLRAAPAESWRASLAVDVYQYIKFAVAQKALTGKSAAADRKLQTKIALQESSMMSEQALASLGYKAASRGEFGQPQYTDPAIQNLHGKLVRYSIQAQGFSPAKLARYIKRGQHLQAQRYANDFGLITEWSRTGKTKQMTGIRAMELHEILAKRDAQQQKSPMRQFIDETQKMRRVAGTAGSVLIALPATPATELPSGKANATEPPAKRFQPPKIPQAKPTKTKASFTPGSEAFGSDALRFLAERGGLSFMANSPKAIVDFLRSTYGEARFQRIEFLFSDSSLSRARINKIRARVAAKAGGQYKNVNELRRIIDMVLKEDGIDLNAWKKEKGQQFEKNGNAFDKQKLDTVHKDALEGVLLIQLMPDNVPLYRSIETAHAGKASKIGSSYWGVGDNGMKVASSYATPQRIFIKTTLGEMRKRGIVRSDEMAVTGNALELYHAEYKESWATVSFEVVGPKRVEYPARIQDFIKQYTRGYFEEVTGRIIPGPDPKPLIELINKIGTRKLDSILKAIESNPQAHANLDVLLGKATDPNRPNRHVADFLQQASVDQILLLVRYNKTRAVVSVMGNKGYLDMLGGDPASHVTRIEKITDPGVRNLLLALTAQREFQLRKKDPSRKSKAGLELLLAFGIDPSTHKVFPWNSSDVMDRASLYFRVKAERASFQAQLAKAIPDKPAAVEKLVTDIWKLIKIQDVKDTHLPFTPHGWKHTFDVAKLQRKIYRDSPALRKALISQYGSEAKALAVLDLVALMHDVGYGALKEGESKGRHAIRSGELFQAQIAKHAKRTLGLSDKQVKDIFLAIERHGADKKGKPGYMEASLDNPLLFVIRLADNLDSSINRLRKIQTNPIFIEAMREMNTLESKPELMNDTNAMKKAETQIKERYYTRLQSKLPESDAALAIELLQKMNHTSWPHFKGCEKVSDVLIQEVNGQLVVNFRIAGYANSGIVKEKATGGTLHVESSQYQLWRAYTASQSLDYNGKALKFRYQELLEGDPRDGGVPQDLRAGPQSYAPPPLKAVSD